MNASYVIGYNKTHSHWSNLRCSAMGMFHCMLSVGWGRKACLPYVKLRTRNTVPVRVLNLGYNLPKRIVPQEMPSIAPSRKAFQPLCD